MRRPRNVVTLHVVPVIVQVGEEMVASPTRVVLALETFYGPLVHNGYIEAPGDIDLEIHEEDHPHEP